MDQLSFDGMPDRLYAATPSRIATYRDCPRRYRLAYLDRPAPSRGPARGDASVGAAVHTALARWWGLPRARRTPEAGGALLVRAWLRDGFRDAGQLAAARDRARAYVEGYLAGLDPDREPVGVERTVTARTEHASLWGRADRIDDRPRHGLVVVDYKTGRWEPTSADAGRSTALAVYAAGIAAALRRRCTRVELHHLPSGRVTAFDHTDASLAEHLQRADEVATELAVLDVAAPSMGPEESDAAFPARVAERCGSCEVRSACGPGRSVPARAPWDGVVTD